MDKTTKAKSDISKHVVFEKEKGDNQEIKQSRLPVRIHPSKNESSGSVITSASAPVKSKLPMKKPSKNEGSSKSKVVLPKTSRIPVFSPRVSRAESSVQSENSCSTIADESLSQYVTILQEKSTNFKPQDPTIEIKWTSSASEDIKNIVRELKDFQTKSLKDLAEVSKEHLAPHIVSVVSQDIDLHFIDEELSLTGKTDSFYARETLEQRINEYIKGIKNSVNSTLEQNSTPEPDAENIDTEMNMALDEIFSKFHFNQELESCLPEESNHRIIAKAETDIVEITSDLKLCLTRKVREIKKAVSNFSSLPQFESLPEPLHINLAHAEDFLLSDCICVELNKDSEIPSDQQDLAPYEQTNLEETESSEIEVLHLTSNFPGKEIGPQNALRPISFASVTDYTQSIEAVKMEQPEVSEKFTVEESNEKNSAKTDENMNITINELDQEILHSEKLNLEYVEEDWTEEELVEHIKGGLVELKSQIILNSDEPQVFERKSSASVSTTTEEIEKRSQDRLISSSTTSLHKSTVEEVAVSNPSLLLEKHSRVFVALGDLMAGKDFSLKKLTTEFIEYVRTDMSALNSKPTHCVPESKRYTFLRLLNEMEDLISEVNESPTKESLKKLPLSRESDTHDESDKTFFKVLQELDRLDDCDNEKLEDLMELSKFVVKTKIPSSTSSKVKFPPGIKSLHKSYIPILKTNPSRSFGKSSVAATGIKNSMAAMKTSNSEANTSIKLSPKCSQIPISTSSPATFRGGCYQKADAERMNKTKPPIILPTPVSSNEKQNSDESQTLLILHKKLKSRRPQYCTTKRNEPKPKSSCQLWDTRVQSALVNRSSSNSIASTPTTVNGQCSFAEIAIMSRDSACLPNKYNVFNMPMLPEKILDLWDTKSMLAGRSVCREWSAGITNSSVFRKRIVVLKPMDIITTWEALQVSSFYQFGHPNLCVMRCDLRESSAVEFFEQNCANFKHLSLEHCMFSLAILQQLLLNCVHLEHLEIHGFPEYILFSEKIFPFTNSPICLTELKTLILNSFGRENSISSLSLGFISHFINSSVGLDRVELIGWKSMTATNFLKLLLTDNPTLDKITRLAFSGIPLSELDFDHFIILALAPHNLKLRSLEFSFTGRQTVFTRGRDYANLIMREIVRIHSQTLEELNLTNCPITEEIFLFPMPKLRRAFLCGTNISNTEFQLKMPNLEELKTDIARNSCLLSSPNIIQDYHGPDDWYQSNTCIVLSWIFCLAIGPIIYLFNPGSAGLPFFLMAFVFYLMTAFSDLF